MCFTHGLLVFLCVLDITSSNRTPRAGVRVSVPVQDYPDVRLARPDCPRSNHPIVYILGGGRASSVLFQNTGHHAHLRGELRP